MARDLKTIALELLEKYEDSKMGIIWEYSGMIEEDEKALKVEVEKYRKEIEEASK